MGISQYIREIGRGRDGSRDLTQDQACDLWGRLLDGHVSDLEIGAFCVAMRIKGETPAEMSGFLQATRERLALIDHAGGPPVVLPSYNGSRKLPVLTPLLGMLLAARGVPVVMHGTPTDSVRVHTPEVLALLGVAARGDTRSVAAGELAWFPTGLLCPGLQRLLEVRQVVGLRNPAHSLVKRLNPCRGRALVIGSYTHPEYAVSMAATFERTGADALLLRGTEGEPVADPRRQPQMEAFLGGKRRLLQAALPGSLVSIPELPPPDAPSTARYTRAVLDGQSPVPAPLAMQVAQILQVRQALLGGSSIT
ncbi:MAG: DNA-binding protein YbiB [Rhodoferax sp.]|nr:DNA-binding protein YbiB [Rhodoferax sp.]